MAHRRLLHKGQCRCLFPLPGDKTLKDLGFLIGRAPKVVHLAIELHVHLVEVSTPVPEAFYPAHALMPDVACKQRPELVPPNPHGLMADIDPSLKQQVFDVAQAQRLFHIHHPNPADRLRR